MEKQSRQPLDLNAVRERLARSKGRDYWRSLEEIAETDDFKRILEDEFPQQARTWGIHVDRRQFLHLMGASLALAGLSGCRYLPEKKIVPYVKQPEELTPGLPLYFASAYTLSGYATGILVESHEGRPTKIEGNPDHPASLGASNVFTTASILHLYDPDRARAVKFVGEDNSWEGFLTALREELANQAKTQGAGLRILTEAFSSPTLAEQIGLLLKKYPQAKWHQWEPVNRDNARAGTLLAFGEALNPVYHFDKANVVVSLDSEFLVSMPGSIRYARDFMNRRRIRDVYGELGRSDSAEMNRLYNLDTTPTITGAVADYNLPVRQAEVENFARALAAKLGVDAGAAPSISSPELARWLDPLVADLQANKGASLVVAGDQQPPAIHALAHAMNSALGNIGATVVYTDPIEVTPPGFTSNVDSLRDLVNDMKADKVTTLLILGGNPVYSAPADIDFGKVLQEFSEKGVRQTDYKRFSAHLSLYEDETSRVCQWNLPEAHYLEAWGDTRGHDGTVSIVQPLILPLYAGRSCIDLLTLLMLEPENMTVTPGYDTLVKTWKGQRTEPNFDKFWQITLNNGVMADTALPAKTPTPRSLASNLPPAPPAAQGLDIVFRPDPAIYDGRFSNNPWLQELPKPITKVAWDNACYISPKTSDAQNIHSEDKIEITLNGRKMESVIWVVPGHPDDAITVHLGYGRANAGNVGNEVGFNTQKIRTADAPWFASGVAVQKTGYYPIACTEHHFSIDTKSDKKVDNDETRDDPEFNPLKIDTTQGRNIIHIGTVEEYRKQKQAPKREGDSFKHVFWPEDEKEMDKQPNLYDTAQVTDHKYEGFGTYHWGMSIDLNTCIACNACVMACVAENNIPTVGKREVQRGREMQWIRIDRYYRGNDLENPNVNFQPMMCQHCEQAPCEPVCPVAATVHSHEGLNQMVYNRCVGTRYCSNNCPYKVRRFNFLKYTEQFDNPTFEMMMNPNVTVRSRGVMEKCSYCVQRINAARIEAKKDNREILDGEILTACQQACPTQTIVFGDIKNPKSQVSKLKRLEHDYGVLTDLNTFPRTSYLAKLTNPNATLGSQTIPSDETKTE